MSDQKGNIQLRRSQAALAAARNFIPGGVNSPVRAFQAVGGVPPFIASGHGSHLKDIDGNSYIDYVGSWGPLILGHAHPAVIEELERAARNGLSFGAPTLAETRLAERLCEALPSMQRVRLVSSGTEATMSAIRLARAATGRELIIKFAGCYHGHVDALLAEAGSGALTFGRPSSPGIPDGVTAGTLVARFNDLDNVRALVEKHGEDIAAMIVEPIAGNMGVIPPEPGFLKGLRHLCDRQGILLIFDEVMTGFRVAWGGAQALYGVRPDLTTLGKIIGGGMPIGAYGGRADLMSEVSPEGPVYQAGTLSGNPVSVACGLATLEVLSAEGVYEELELSSARLSAGLADAFERHGLRCVMRRVGSMMTSFFTGGTGGTGGTGKTGGGGGGGGSGGGGDRVIDYDTARRCDTGLYGRYFQGMLRRGIYLAPSQFEALFVSLAHSEEDIQATIEAADETCGELAG